MIAIAFIPMHYFLTDFCICVPLLCAVNNFLCVRNKVNIIIIIYLSSSSQTCV